MADIFDQLGASPSSGDIFDSIAPQAAPPKPTATISASKPGGAGQYLRDIESDIRYGQGQTVVGRMLRAAGAPGLNVGSQAAAGDFMGSPLLGAVHAAQGVQETPQHPIRGPLKAVGGALEAATIPASFMGGPIAEGAAEAVPSAKWAAGVFNHLKSAIPDVPVNTQAAEKIASRAVELSERGHGALPPPVSDFVNRITAPGAKPLSYAEAQDFVQAASKLSAKEMAGTTGAMRHAIKEFAGQLRSDISGAVHGVSDGLGGLYDQAVRDYNVGSRIRDTKQFIKQEVGKNLIRGAAYATGAGAAGGAIYEGGKVAGIWGK